jgi:hypothetical protein
MDFGPFFQQEYGQINYTSSHLKLDDIRSEGTERGQRESHMLLWQIHYFPHVIKDGNLADGSSLTGDAHSGRIRCPFACSLYVKSNTVHAYIDVGNALTQCKSLPISYALISTIHSSRDQMMVQIWIDVIVLRQMR